MNTLSDVVAFEHFPEASSWELCGVSHPCHYKERSSHLEAFLISADRLSHDRLAMSGPDDKKPDALKWNHGAESLCEASQKTTKLLNSAHGPRYGRSIEESHHLVDSSLGEDGYKGSSTARGSLSPKEMR